MQAKRFPEDSFGIWKLSNFDIKKAKKIVGFKKVFLETNRLQQERNGSLLLSLLSLDSREQVIRLRQKRADPQKCQKFSASSLPISSGQSLFSPVVVLCDLSRVSRFNGLTICS